MAQKEYLSEEEYQKNNKKVKIAGIIVMIIGICLAIAGIAVLKSASEMEIPHMSDSNWFEKASGQSEREFKGSAMVMFGIFITFVGCMIRFVVANQRKIMAYQTQQAMPIVKEGFEEMSPTLGTAAKEIAKGVKEGMSEGKTKFCKHCGTKIDGDSKFCSECGKEQ